MGRMRFTHKESIQICDDLAAFRGEIGRLRSNLSLAEKALRNVMDAKNCPYEMARAYFAERERDV